MEEQRQLAKDALECHQEYSSSRDGSTDWTVLSTSTSSLHLKLGIGCGSDLSQTLPLAVNLASRAFQSLTPRGLPEKCTLTGLALLYGPHASMNAHYDSPTQPQQCEEWLVMMTVGNDVQFRCNEEFLLLHSGDALVMDSMAVLHGVEQVVVCNPDMASTFGLPVTGSRLGVLLWQGRSAVSTEMKSEAVDLEAGTMEGLFGE